MPKLNKFLVASIIADIKECVFVSNEIYSWLGDIEHLSWKFPTKAAKDIDAMEIVKEHNGTAGEFYILLLELAYDRIQFTLRLMVEFMDKYPLVAEFFEEVTCVHRSNQISLASILRLIWNRLKTIPESISRFMVGETTSIISRNKERLAESACKSKKVHTISEYKERQIHLNNKKCKCKTRKSKVKNADVEARESFASKVSQSSQAGSSVNYCSSCELAGATVLQVTKEIERVFQENKLISAAATGREKCREDIYENTQWAVMSKLTRGIETDVETALRIVNENQLRTRAIVQDRDRTIRELRGSLTMQEKQSTVLQSEKYELKEQLENVRAELEKSEETNCSLRREAETLKKTLEDTRRQMSILAGENNILQSQGVMLAESKLELEKTVLGLRKEIQDSRDACFKIERHFRTLLDESRMENQSSKEEHKKKIEELEDEVASLRGVIASKKEKKKLKTVNEKGNVPEETIIKPEDDPVADMTQQLISNREKIEVLSRQNERLSKTLSRLREYRLTGQITTNGPNK